MTVAFDLGVVTAATMLDARLDVVRVDAWRYPRDDRGALTPESAACWLDDILRGTVAEWPRPSLVVCEANWYRGPARPESLEHLSAMRDRLSVWATSVGARFVPLDPCQVARELRIPKRSRVAEMPIYVNGLNYGRFIGPRGGRELLPHVADSAFLAYYAATRVTGATT